MKSFLFGLFFMVSNVYADCQEFRPVSEHACRTAYAVSYDHNAKVPKVVSYVLTPEMVNGCTPRQSHFTKDNELDSASDSDYAKSGYDKGHLAPADDMTLNQQLMSESMLLSNIAPQVPKFNRGAWKQLEMYVRQWVLQFNEPVLVYTGSIYDNTDQKLNGKVVIPHAFYKIIVRHNSYMAFIMPNLDIPSGQVFGYATSVNKIEQLTGLKFNLVVPSSYWPMGKTIAHSCSK